MAVRIRLRRVGRKKQPHYRIVVAESTSPRDGRFIEIIGHYHPRQAENSLEVKVDRANHWLDNGALPSDTVLIPYREEFVAEVDVEQKRMVIEPPEGLL